MRGLSQRMRGVDVDAWLNRLMEGEEYDPEATAAMVREVTLDAEAAKAEHALLNGAARQLGHIKGRTTEEQYEAMQDYLADALAQVVSEAATLAADHPGTVTLATAMGDPTLVEVAKAQVRLTGALESIRTHQRRAYPSESGDELRRMINESGRLRDAWDSEAVWIQRRHDVASNDRRMHQLRSAGRADDFDTIPDVPFPVSSASKPWPGSDGWAYLAWVSTHAQPWVPTLDELVQAHEENRVRIDGAPRKWTMLGQRIYSDPRVTQRTRDQLIERGTGD